MYNALKTTSMINTELRCEKPATILSIAIGNYNTIEPCKIYLLVQNLSHCVWYLQKMIFYVTLTGMKIIKLI